MIRIVHLSDLHIDKNEIEKYENHFIPALVNDLKKYNLENQINLIIFSGDIIDKGGKSFGSLTEGLNYFNNSLVKKLTESLGIKRNRIFIAPGNHDIDRDADEPFTNDGLKKHLDTEDSIDDFIKRTRTTGIDRIIEFKAFEKEFYNNYPLEKQLTNFQSTFKLNINNIKIGISCFNSAWRCYDSDTDKGNILIGEKQITDSTQFTNDCELKFAIVHHSFDYLAPFDSKCCETAIRSNYNLLMCGHIHEGTNWAKTDMYGSIFVSVAPSNWTGNLRSDSRQYANGYSIIDYDSTNDKIVNHARRYYHLKKSFDPNPELGDENGIQVYPIPTTEEKRLSKYRQDLCERVFEVHRDDMNDHLLSSNPQIDAPKNIEDLYVNPRLRKKKDFQIKDKEDQFIDIAELYNSDSNFIIFGERESGKTLLLDKLVIEFTKASMKIQKIPVYINYDDIGNKRIEQMINNYLGIGITEVKPLLNQHRIVLLIDNLSYEKSRKLLNLIDFIEKNNVQAIVCSDTTLQGNITPELFSYKLFSQFNILFLELFNSKEIKELVHKWFFKDKDYEHPDRVKRVVNSLVALNLPRTPLAISMFLWIMEQQEISKPKNHAAMLQNFIEKMFAKTSEIDVYSQDFDYTNKIILLTDIAYEMYIRNEENYRIQYVDLTKFIQENLKSKKFDFNYQEVLDDFIFRGMLSTEVIDNITYVRFRFNCFFSYMLMNKMDIDPKFLEYTLLEKNYLKFVQEIDYFTALKRTRSDILIKIFSRLQEIYGSKIATIENNEFGFDSLHKNYENSLIVDNLGYEIIKNINNKPCDAEVDSMIDDMNDHNLEEIASDKERCIIKKTDDISNLQEMDRVLYLSSKLLKNTEETTIEDLKYKCYTDVLKCSMCYMKIFIEFLEQQVKTNNVQGENIDLYKIYDRFAPVINEMSFHLIMGTNKLKTVIREKIENDKLDNNVSDYERFLSVFLYADLHGEDFLLYIGEFIKRFKHPYIKDMILFKLMHHYIFFSKTKSSDKLYIQKIVVLIESSSKSQKVGKGALLKFDKTAAINNLKKLKEDTLSSITDLPLQ